MSDIFEILKPVAVLAVIAALLIFWLVSCVHKANDCHDKGGHMVQTSSTARICVSADGRILS